MVRQGQKQVVVQDASLNPRTPIRLISHNGIDLHSWRHRPRIVLSMLTSTLYKMEWMPAAVNRRLVFKSDIKDLQNEANSNYSSLPPTSLRASRPRSRTSIEVLIS